MSSLPLDVHEVLEEEYVSMYGDLRTPGSSYTADDIRDENSARSILVICGIEVPDPIPPGSAKEVLRDTLNGFVEKGRPDLDKLCASPAITRTGTELLSGYEKYSAGVTPGRKREINRHIVDDALSGAVRPLRDVRLANVYNEVHLRPKESARTALCISGGGIRTATFALGVIQGLASAGILEKFDYLSTVSGGGYIGSWLSSWARRHPNGIHGVQDDLVRADTAVEGSTIGGQTKMRGVDEIPATKIDPEPGPVRHLREYSNYLSPRLGLASADTWTMASLYMRNLLLNLLVLIPILAAALAVPRLFSHLLAADATYRQEFLLLVMLVALAVGFGYLGAARPTVHGRQAGLKYLRKINTDGGFVVLCVLPLIVAATSLSLFWGKAAENPSLIVADIWWGIAAAAIMIFLPCVIYYIRFARASAFERRESLEREQHATEHFWKKFGYEFAGTVLGFATAVALLVLFAKKVFDRPVRPVPDLTWVPPYLRGLFSDVPMSALYVCFAIPLILVVFFIQASIFVGISGRRNEDYDREWWGRAGAWLLMSAVLLAAASAISVFGPVFLYRAPLFLSSIGGISGVAAAILGFSAKTPANDKEKDKGGKTSPVTSLGLSLAVPLFVLIFLAAISLGTTWIIQIVKGSSSSDVAKWASSFQSSATVTQTTQAPAGNVESKLEYPPTALLSVTTMNGVAHLQTIYSTGWCEIGAIAGAALFAVFFSFFIGVNRFSMHALYRDRLIRAYLGASRYNRDPDHFTGFDAHDNLQMYELRHELFWPTSFADVREFVGQLKKNFISAGSVEEKIWNALDKKTRQWLEEPEPQINDILINAVIQNLNGIILSEDLGPGTAEVEPVVRACRNREIIQQAFASSLQVRPLRSPFHVVNTCLNLTGGGNLAWQQRKGASFTVSPLHAGSLYVGYRDAKKYAGDDGISIGTALTISGAAASPNQGYNSSPPLAFLMTLLNVRLGSWLGNPGLAGESTYADGQPRTNLEPLLWELTGSTNDHCPLVYLSDGGHFENLGIYEMILRRCRYIVVSDGGCDPKYTFEDLGNAMRKIRTDLGVPIDIRKMFMFPRTPDNVFPEGRYVAIASIRYSAIDAKPLDSDGKPKDIDGTLVYIKPGLYSEDYFPKDVYNYATSSADFPHETTADQFFSESQFESYRALGRHVVNEICGNYASGTPVAMTYSSIAAFVASISVHPAASLKPEQIIAQGLDKLTTAVLSSK
jgi:hypothetical protein